MYIWFDRYCWLNSDEKRPRRHSVLGEFSRDDPESFWKYMKEKQGWYDNGALIDFMRYSFDFPHPTYICVVMRSKRSGKIMVQPEIIKRSARSRREIVHYLPVEFCYNKEAAVDSFMYNHYVDTDIYSDFEFMKEFDTEDRKHFLYKADCEYDRREDWEDNHGDLWVLPEEIIHHPYQEEIVDYIKKEFATKG